MSLVRLAVTVLVAAVAAVGCGQSDNGPLTATARLELDRTAVPFGGPLEMSYRFVVAAEVPLLGADEQVFVHFRDLDGELLWADDHAPSLPAAQWRPGMVVDYTRAMFLPRVPYIGTVDVEIGLASPTTGVRRRLGALSVGQRAYRAETFEILAETNPVEHVEGWHMAEQSANSPSDVWRWSRGDGRLHFVNPREDAVLYLDVDQPVMLPVAQRVAVRTGAVVLDEFDLPAGVRMTRRIEISQDALGDEPVGEVTVSVDRVFVPQDVEGLGSADARQLGVRVFHAVLLSS